MSDKLEYPHDFADLIYRDDLKKTENLRDFVSEVIPDIARGLVFERAELLDREFLLEDWRRRESDLLFRIPYRDGQTELVTLICILIEHQSQPDARMPLRLLIYAVMYWEREWKAWEALPVPRPDFKLTPIIPIVFHTSDRVWNTSRQVADMLSGPELFKAFAPSWPVCFWDLAAKTPRELLDSTHTWLKALAIPRAGGEDIITFAAILTEAIDQLAGLRAQSEIRWYDLRHFVLSWATKLRVKEEHPRILDAVRQARLSESDFQEIQTMSLTIAEAYIQEGREKGREQGREEGVIIGRIQVLESLLNRPVSPIHQFDARSLDELQQLEAELKAQLANRSSSPTA